MVGRSGGGRPDIDVGISDTTVSSEQATIEVEPQGISIEDRGSRNGTSVNGRTIAAGVRVPVVHGDRVKFGSFETIVVLVPYPAGS
jgi:pSer/pThr/pTyr-binding forkhead associated (FHA) protein